MNDNYTHLNVNTFPREIVSSVPETNYKEDYKRYYKSPEGIYVL